MKQFNNLPKDLQYLIYDYIKPVKEMNNVVWHLDYVISEQTCEKEDFESSWVHTYDDEKIKFNFPSSAWDRFLEREVIGSFIDKMLKQGRNNIN